MKKYLFSLIITAVVFSTDSFAQKTVFKIGVFAPLYLDSAFNNNSLHGNTIPKYTLPALEFVQGAMIAFDTLSFPDLIIEAHIYDVKSATEPLSMLIKNKELDSLDLLIGGVKDLDYKMLADYALRKNTPFISCVYPNDGGVTGNPFVAIVNSTLKAHCEAIYTYIVQKHGTDKILLVKKSGTQEDRIAEYFKKINAQDNLLSITTITADSVTTTLLKNKLDSNFKTVIIGASLDERFVKNLTDASFALKNKYNITLIGMPNWDGFKIFAKKGAYKNMPVYYTTPHFSSGSTFDNYLINSYNRMYKGNPTDLVFKGFENVFYFTNLLVKYPNDLMSHLNDPNNMVIHEFNFKPVYVGKKTSVPDYFENKHLYLIRMMNGTVTREW
ncbi:hypothetical protein BH09BAC2_BH09BAC2_16950 [soil metagenome]